MVEVATIAKTFARNLFLSIGPVKFREVRERNKVAAYGCASHDFCDSNMVMEAAMIDLGVAPWARPDSEVFAADLSEEDCGLWNAAWDLARRRHLTAH